MANQEQVARLLRGGVVRWNEWRRHRHNAGKVIDLGGCSFPKAKLRGANLAQVNLRGAHLNAADLSTADLSGANLMESRLRYSHLNEANLCKADLKRAELSQADLKSASLQEANLQDAHLSEADLKGADLRGADLRRADLREADLREVKFARADLRGADLCRADLRGVDLNRTDLTTVKLSRAKLFTINLHLADLSGVNLFGVDLRRADLSGANLSGADLSEANLSGADLRRADLSGANLRGADLSGVNLNGVTLNGVDLSGVNLNGITWTRVDLIGANLSGANFMEARLRSVRLMKANLCGVNWGNASLRGVDFSGADLSGADLSGADLSGADLSNVNLQRTQVLGTSFVAATFTGACLKDWHTNRSTQLEETQVDFVYQDIDKNGEFSDRRPHSGYFRSGEFAALFQQAFDTLDLIFVDGIDWQSFFASFQELRQQYSDADLNIQAIEKKSGGSFVVKLDVNEKADKAALQQSWDGIYEENQQLKAQLSRTEGKLEGYKEQLSDFQQKVLQGMADQNQTTINNNFGNAKIGNFANSVSSNASMNATQNNYAADPKTPAEAAQEIHDLLVQLAKDNPLATDDDRAEHLRQTLAPTRLQRSVELIQTAGEAAVESLPGGKVVTAVLKKVREQEEVQRKAQGGG